MLFSVFIAELFAFWMFEGIGIVWRRGLPDGIGIVNIIGCWAGTNCVPGGSKGWISKMSQNIHIEEFIGGWGIDPAPVYWMKK